MGSLVADAGGLDVLKSSICVVVDAAVVDVHVLGNMYRTATRRSGFGKCAWRRECCLFLFLQHTCSLLKLHQAPLLPNLQFSCTQVVCLTASICMIVLATAQDMAHRV